MVLDEDDGASTIDDLGKDLNELTLNILLPILADDLSRSSGHSGNKDMVLVKLIL
jgi:hypothetical protein